MALVQSYTTVAHKKAGLRHGTLTFAKEPSEFRSDIDLPFQKSQVAVFLGPTKVRPSVMVELQVCVYMYLFIHMCIYMYTYIDTHISKGLQIADSAAFYYAREIGPRLEPQALGRIVSLKATRSR